MQTPAGSRDIYKTVNSGASFGSNPLRQELGLGDATAITQLEIFWPATGGRQVLRGLELDHGYRVVEGDAQAVPVELPRITFNLGAKHAHQHAMPAHP